MCIRDRALSDLPIKVYAGADALSQIVESQPIDIVLASMVGYAGLRPTINAIKAGKAIALANKETLVVEMCIRDSFGGISTTAFQAFTEFFYTGWLNENRQCAAAILFFDITSAYSIYVKNHILSGFHLFFHLCFQGSVETVFVYFFVFQKFIIGNALFEFLRR